MHCFLSITNLLLALLFSLHTAAHAESIPLPVVRQKGASLDLSLAQEADHAARLARTWLLNHPPSGTDTQTCALVKLVLDHESPPAHLLTYVAAAGLIVQTNQLQAQLAACLTNYPPNVCEPEILWQVSRAINQLHNGMLMRDAQPLDWRNDFATLLIGSQRRSLPEGAYWSEAKTADPGCPLEPHARRAAQMSARIRATAFGILALKEIHE